MAPRSGVVDIGTSPTAVDWARAYEDFKAGHIVRMVGGSPESLFQVLRIRLDQASVQSTLKTEKPGNGPNPRTRTLQGVIRAVAIRRAANGVLHEFQTFTPPDDPQPQSS
jgi:hypothetical protein